ncbi:MAG: Ca2+-dependent phosphoinositide-specific phospholipase C, partial [Waterburya sp.]
VFPPEQLITPDDLRGDYGTLKEAVMTDGWPTLAEVQGKIIFVMDNRNDLYLERYPGLKGATLFASAKESGTDEGIFINTNEPNREIPDLVKQGYIVRTRADGDTLDARVGSTERRDQAIQSGAQYISTDYPKPNEYFSDFMVLFADDTLIRCNPLNTNDNCRIKEGKSR